VITAEETGTKPQERDVVSTALEKNGEIMLGCSGRNSLKEGAVWHNRTMRELLKFRNLKERDCATVAERCRVLPPLPSPSFASLRVLLGYVISIGSRNNKEGSRNLSRYATIAAA
jgi:hypothetical protein